MRAAATAPEGSFARHRLRMYRHSRLYLPYRRLRRLRRLHHPCSRRPMYVRTSALAPRAPPCRWASIARSSLTSDADARVAAATALLRRLHRCMSSSSLKCVSHLTMAFSSAASLYLAMITSRSRFPRSPTPEASTRRIKGRTSSSTISQQIVPALLLPSSPLAQASGTTVASAQAVHRRYGSRLIGRQRWELTGSRPATTCAGVIQ